MKCRTCGTTLSAGALLCGECGTSAIAPAPTLGDTARYDRQALIDAIADEGRARAARSGRPVGGGDSGRAAEGAPVTSTVQASPPTPGESAWSASGVEADPAAPSAPPAPTPPAPTPPAPTPVATPSPTSAPAPVLIPTAAEPAREKALFHLVFSTGESVRVSGSGLIGRNPTPDAGERVDYLVQIVDPQRSVSKTHLRFGVDDGELWVADRGSSNGTRVGLDLLEPIELAPGRAQRVFRGTRVGIGDQYFDVR